MASRSRAAAPRTRAAPSVNRKDGSPCGERREGHARVARCSRARGDGGGGAVAGAAAAAAGPVHNRRRPRLRRPRLRRQRHRDAAPGPAARRGRRAHELFRAAHLHADARRLPDGPLPAAAGPAGQGDGAAGAGVGPGLARADLRERLPGGGLGDAHGGEGAPRRGLLAPNADVPRLRHLRRLPLRRGGLLHAQAGAGLRSAQRHTPYVRARVQREHRRRK